MSHCYAPCRSALTLENRLLFNSFFCNFAKINKNMISNSPEYHIEEVMNQYGIEVPMETVLTYLDSDPYLTPESLYDYVTRYGEEENITAIKLKGYKFIDFEKNYNEIPLSKGVYIWLLKDNAVLPAINGIHPSFTWVEANGSRYRVLYVGLAEKESLFERINNFHLKGNPRSSTLCYSIGAILGLPLYGKIEKSGKRRIHLEQEKWEEIRNWLIQNCYILVKPQNNPRFTPSFIAARFLYSHWINTRRSLWCLCSGSQQHRQCYGRICSLQPLARNNLTFGRLFERNSSFIFNRRHRNRSRSYNLFIQNYEYRRQRNYAYVSSDGMGSSCCSIVGFVFICLSRTKNFSFL